MSVILQHAEDQVAGDATWTVGTGTEDTDYPAAYLADGQVTRPAKLTTDDGAWVGDFGAAQRVDLVALSIHTISPDATCRIQANASNSWGAPSLNEVLTINAPDPDGRVHQAWLDLTAVTGYTETGYRYWRLVVTGNDVPLAVGELWLGAQKRELERPYEWAHQTRELRRTIQHETLYGVRTTYDLLVRQRSWQGLIRASDVDLAVLRGWHRSAPGGVAPVLWIPDSDVSDAWWVDLPSELTVSTLYRDLHDITLGLLEVSPGLPL